MQIFNFNSDNYSEQSDNFSIIVNREIVIDVVGYFDKNLPDAWHVIAGRCHEEQEQPLAFTNIAPDCARMEFDPSQTDDIADIAFTDKTEAMMHAMQIAAKFHV